MSLGLSRAAKRLFGPYQLQKKPDASRVFAHSRDPSDITVVDGQQLPLVTELWNGSAGTSHALTLAQSPPLRESHHHRRAAMAAKEPASEPALAQPLVSLQFF